MRFLSPRTDFVFKRVFASAESHDILLSFLNAILELKPPRLITSVTIIDPYIAPKIKGMKDSYVDVRVVDQSLREYIIEMQVLNAPGFEKRVLYNACKTYAGQIQMGDQYRELTGVVAITITDFVMFPTLPRIVNRFMLRADTNADIALEDLELVFAELPKLTKDEEHLVDTVEKWLYFLKHADDVQGVPPALAAEPAIRHAFDLVNRAGYTQEELDIQMRREDFIYLQRESINFAAEKGYERGLAEGRAENRAEERAEGRREEKAQLLLRLLEKRFPGPPAWDRDRILAATPEALDQGLDRALTAASLDEVFA
ncbi:MAG: Rpn family recombination-promoting nuclease/putative transposase [Magnetococcales bacterium]|nr:Rpn family recombination-promoting nuclease/putative transposase [Magnetococcales bacterium]